MARGGLARLQQHEKEVNKLNVFPVADGDTGTNMCATLGNGIAYARPAERLSDYLKMLSEGMLLGARGNSGVILSQFFKGVYLALNDCGEADPKALAKALLQGSQTAYQSVIKPVEGTILTVMREGIENIKAPSTAEELLTRYIARMKRSLARTPDLLPVLRESGVIDSGGKGLIYIAEGMLMALTGEELPEIEETPVKQTLDFSLFDENSVMNEGYCTEFILQLLLAEGYRQDFDLNDFIAALSALGDSLVVVRDGSRVKVHVHTHTPEKVTALARQYGEFLTFKLENMQLQHNEVLHEKEKTPHKPLGMIAVVNGEGMAQLFEELGCDVVIRCSETMNASAQEFIDAFERVNADEVVVFPNDKNVILAARQAAQLSGDERVHILPSRSVAEGYFAVAMDVIENEVSYRLQSMESGLRDVVTVAETTASRDFSGDGVSCREGDEIVLVGGEITAAGSDWLETLQGALRALPETEDAETCVIFSGETVTEDEKEALSEWLEEEFPLLEAEFIDGGQKFYRWIIGLT